MAVRSALHLVRFVHFAVRCAVGSSSSVTSSIVEGLPPWGDVLARAGALAGEVKKRKRHKPGSGAAAAAADARAVARRHGRDDAAGSRRCARLPAAAAG